MVEGQELTDYVVGIIQAIDRATKDAASPTYNKSPAKLKFNLAVVNVKKAEGGVRLFVVKAEGDYSKEEISKIEFEYENNSPIQASTGRRDFFVVGH